MGWSVRARVVCVQTTQVPQFLLDDAIDAGRGGVTNIIVTQPRRISATRSVPCGLVTRVWVEQVSIQVVLQTQRNNFSASPSSEPFSRAGMACKRVTLARLRHAPIACARCSVATRVAAERGESIGKTVGYSIRMESSRSQSTRLLLCTTGEAHMPCPPPAPNVTPAV